MTCNNCGRENPAEARFCGGCGATLEAAATLTSSVTQLPVEVRYAGFWMRLAAALIDFVVVFFGLLFFGIGSFLLLSFVDLWVVGGPLFFLIPLLYYVLLTGLRGQTLGKMALGIKVIEPVPEVEIADRGSR